MIQKVQSKTARVFEPLLAPRRYKGARGGRGSGKSHFFCDHLVREALNNPGMRFVAIREVQKSIRDSVYQLIVDKIRARGVEDYFDIKLDRIVTPGDGIVLFQGMQDHTADTIKSLEGMQRALVEEAQTISTRSWELLYPTIRAPNSEIWCPWNPRRKSDPVDKFFLDNAQDRDVICVTANWRDNPWFTEESDADRLRDKASKPDRYAHIWEGAYEPSVVGAIWNVDDIANQRLREMPCDAMRIVVGVDPSGSSKVPASKRPDGYIPATGIVVVAEGEDGNGYVLADGTVTGTPSEWGRQVIALYDQWDADIIAVETNYGGEMCINTITSLRPGIPTTDVRAIRKKSVRAEPIASLYAQGRFFHVGSFPELELEMSQVTPFKYEGDGSPNRVDALVWAATELFSRLVAPKKSKPKLVQRPRPSTGAWMA